MYVDPMLYAAEELANAIIIKAAHDYREAITFARHLKLDIRYITEKDLETGGKKYAKKLGKKKR